MVKRKRLDKRKFTQEKPQRVSSSVLTTEERLQMIANLILDKLISIQSKKLEDSKTVL